MSRQLVRRNKILEFLDRRANMRVTQLAQLLHVSRMTVRRDLHALATQGALERVHGGAVIAADQPLERAPRGISRFWDEKSAIAALATEMVGNDLHVFLGGGSTTLCLAQHLSTVAGSRFSTHSIAIANALASGGQKDVQLFGGTLQREANSLIGPETIELISRRRFDIAFVGVSAIDVDHGLLEPTEWHALFARTVRRASRRLVVLADYSKFRARSDIVVLRLEDVDDVVTDRPLAERAFDVVSSAGARLVHP